jgi:hypothetical protein
LSGLAPLRIRNLIATTGALIVVAVFASRSWTGCTHSTSPRAKQKHPPTSRNAQVDPTTISARFCAHSARDRAANMISGRSVTRMQNLLVVDELARRSCRAGSANASRSGVP